MADFLASAGGGEKVVPERLEPVELPRSYFVSSLLTFCGLLLLLVGYFMLTVGAVVGFFWLLYAAIVNDWMSGDWEWTFWLFVFGGPALMVMVYFMVLPLFDRRGLQPQFLTLTERDQKQFFLFLKRLCNAMDAPMPDEVALDCRANASVRRISSFFSRREKLQLLVGTPMIQGLSALQLAGVLAHELAHFRQRGGRRLGYAIEGIGNLLETVAYRRNSRSDQILREKLRLQEGLIGIAFYGVAVAMVKAARKVCQGLAWVGRVISSHHSRQLEYDADRWQASLVGKERFSELMREIILLDFSFDRALDSMGEHQDENRFPIDFADYGLAFRGMLDEEFTEKFWQSMLGIKTGKFDSHPSPADRLANIERFRRIPPSELDLPAKALMRSWTGVSQLATRVYYCQVIGEAIVPENLYSSDELLGNLERNTEIDDTHLRYFAGAWPWLMPLRFMRLYDYVSQEMAKRPGVDMTEAAKRQLSTQRGTMMREAPKMFDVRSGFVDGIGRLCRFRSAEHLRAANALEILKNNEIPTDPAVLMQQQQAAIQSIRRGEKEHAAFEHAASFRLALALAGPEVGRSAELREQAEPLLEFLKALEPQIERIRGILVEQAILQTIENLGEEFHFPVEYLERRTKLARGLMSRLKQIYFDLESVPYVVDDEKQSSVSTWLLQMPESTVTSILGSASTLLENLPTAVFRTLGRLAAIAEQIEAEMGLQPLDLTPEEPE